MACTDTKSKPTAMKPEEVARHVGTAWDFLDRCQTFIAQVPVWQPADIRELEPFLLRWIADARNLDVAWQHAAEEGGEAPGPNGWRHKDFTKRERYRLLRLIHVDILNDRYRPGPTRPAWIPKGSGKGVRAISTPNVEDKAVQRGVVQIFQPLIIPTFDSRSFCLPSKGTLHALACAEDLVRKEQRTVWIAEDVFDAFRQIPHTRLMDVLRKRLPVPDVLRLIERLIAGGKSKGLDQGSALSPFLANLFFDHFLDRPWRKLFPNVPLLRFMDDVLVLCGPDDRPADLHRELTRLVREAGLCLKGTPATCIHDLASGDHATWLGYCITTDADGLVVTLPAKANRAHRTDRLRRKFSDAHAKPDSCQRAVQVIRSFLDHAGPCYAFMDHEAVYSQIRAVAGEMGFEEIPDITSFVAVWQRTSTCWEALRPGVDPGSECSGRSDAGSDGRQWSLTPQHRQLHIPPNVAVTIYTDGACLPRTKAGGWACVIRTAGRRRLVRCGRLRRTTNNRAELLAVIRGLETLAEGNRVKLVTDSEYVALGINERLKRWKRQNWRTGKRRGRKPVRNVDLWQKLDQLIQQHRVSCEWVPGHAGHPENELCDRLANRAARKVTPKTLGRATH